MVELIDRSVDLLSPRAGQLGIVERGKPFHASLFQALPQHGLTSPLLAVKLVAFGECALKRAVVLAGRDGEEMGHPHIRSHHWRIWRSLEGDLLLIGQGEPPASRLPGQRPATVKELTRKELLLIAGKLDGKEEDLRRLQGGASQ